MQTGYTRTLAAVGFFVALAAVGGSRASAIEQTCRGCIQVCIDTQLEREGREHYEYSHQNNCTIRFYHCIEKRCVNCYPVFRGGKQPVIMEGVPLSDIVHQHKFFYGQWYDEIRYINTNGYMPPLYLPSHRGRPTSYGTSGNPPIDVREGDMYEDGKLVERDGEAIPSDAGVGESAH